MCQTKKYKYFAKICANTAFTYMLNNVRLICQWSTHVLFGTLATSVWLSTWNTKALFHILLFYIFVFACQIQRGVMCLWMLQNVILYHSLMNMSLSFVVRWSRSNRHTLWLALPSMFRASCLLYFCYLVVTCRYMYKTRCVGYGCVFHTNCIMQCAHVCILWSSKDTYLHMCVAPLCCISFVLCIVIGVYKLMCAGLSLCCLPFF